MSMGDSHSNGSGNGADVWRDSRVTLNDMVACVTGAAQGIGEATCIALAREGVKAIAAVDISDRVQDFANDANKRFGRELVHAFRGDTTDDKFRRSVFDEMERRAGHVSICVPAAGITRDRLAVKIGKDSGLPELYSIDDFRRVIEVDMTAPIYWGIETIGRVAKYRYARGLKRWTPEEPVQGCVVFIGSVSSVGNRGQVSYATAKAGLEGAQETLAAEAIFFGVRSVIVHPGYTDTSMVRTLGEDFISGHILPQTRLGRLIRPDEIASTIIFCIRNAAITGTLWVDAGWHPKA